MAVKLGDIIGQIGSGTYKLVNAKDINIDVSIDQTGETLTGTELLVCDIDGAGDVGKITVSQLGTVLQPLDVTLTSIALLGTAANKMLYTTNTDVWAETALTAAGRAILDDATAAAQLITLGLTSTAEELNLLDGVTTTATRFNYLNAATGTTGITSTNLVFSTSPTLVTPTLGVALATSIQIGANTLDTTEWAFLDGQDQDVSSGSAPTFTADNLSDGGSNAIVTTTQETNWDTHLSSDGSDHSFIDQNVTTIADVVHNSLTTVGDVNCANLVLATGTPSISSPDAIDLKPSGDADDYFQFTTAGGVPTIDAVGGANLDFLLNGTQCLRISNSGFFCYGTTFDLYRFSDISVLANALAFKRARGSKASPSAVTSGNKLGSLGFYGYGGNIYHKGGAKIAGYANEAFDDTKSTCGTRMEFYTTPDGSGTQRETVTIEASGILSSIYGVATLRSTANTSNPPTDAELDSAFGAPSTVGAGFVGILDDNDAGANVYICVSTGTDADKWWYVALTQAP